MTAPAWMPFYVGDYLKDTGNLGALEHGAYLLLILHYWQHGGLPSDEDELAAIARLSVPEWEKARRRLSKFFHDGWKHKRVDAELAIACETIAKRSASGKRAAYARYNKRMPDEPPPHSVVHAPLPKKDSSSSEPLEPTLRARVFKSLGDPIGFFEEGELNSIALKFPKVDHEARLKTFWPWGIRQDKTPTEIKAMYVARMKNEEGSTSLVEDRKNAPSVAPSPQLVANLKAKGWDDLKLPQGFDRRQRRTA